ncbi:MAG: helix-turn-helix transcriptional regulator [Candidatus Cloacimonetes bacterium]|nr:helix-turn-helix transcriptional regulator [Candidatus Cloacimonadota bacterium]
MLVCNCKQISSDDVTRMVSGMPPEVEIDRLAEFFKVFGDPTRLRIIYYLSCTELCVHDLSALVGMQQSAVSHQLKILRLNRLVKSRKEGTMVFYSLDDRHVDDLYATALAHIREQ